MSHYWLQIFIISNIDEHRTHYLFLLRSNENWKIIIACYWLWALSELSYDNVRSLLRSSSNFQSQYFGF